MRILLLGHKGMLGSDALSEFQRRGFEVQGKDLPELDISDPLTGAKLAAGKFGKLDWVVNCAAYTAVDRAESEPDEAMKMNALGPSYIARAGAIGGFRMLHVSTDFVFDGNKPEPYVEDDPPNPKGAYARSKWEGERAVRQAGCEAIVVRTAWLFGPNGASFPRTLIRAALAGKPLQVVSDQVGSPTYTADLARVLADLLELAPEPGVYHAAGPEAMSWHELATRSIEIHRREFLHDSNPVKVSPIETDDWPTMAPRPKYSVLSFEKLRALGIAPMRPIDEALTEFVKRLPADP